MSPAAPAVLVTGATGFVARHALAPLVASGFAVHAVARGSTPDSATDGVTWHRCDLLDRDAARRLVDAVAPSHLLHAAWYLEPGAYLGSSLNLDWVAASIDLALSFRRSGGRRLVTVGSCFEYEHGPSSVLPETSPLRPSTVYGAAKCALHTALEALSAATGLQTAWARLFYLYGPGEDRRRLIGDIACSVLEGKEVATSPGLVRRDYMYVEDAADALVALLSSEVIGAVNVATGEAPPVRELVERVARAAGRPDLVAFGARPAAPGEPAEIRADVTRLRRDVGWSDAIPSDEAAERTVSWWRSRVGVPA